MHRIINTVVGHRVQHLLSQFCYFRLVEPGHIGEVHDVPLQSAAECLLITGDLVGIREPVT